MISSLSGTWAAARRGALHLATGAMVAIGASAAAPVTASAAFMPFGPQNDIPVATVTGTWGWSVCYSGNYSEMVPLSTVLSGCTGDNLMLAARPVGSLAYDVLAAAPAADVLFNTGTGNTTHSANGSEWYYSPSYSWGFAGAGDVVNRTSCDVNGSAWTGGNERDRLCWHTSSNIMTPGWRSGNNIDVFTASWERVILTSSASEVSTPEPGTLGMIGVALAGLGAARRRARAA